MVVLFAEEVKDSCRPFASAKMPQTVNDAITGGGRRGNESEGGRMSRKAANAPRRDWKETCACKGSARGEDARVSEYGKRKAGGREVMPSVMLSTPKSDVRARYEEGKEQLNECKACQTGVDEFDDLLNYIGTSGNPCLWHVMIIGYNTQQ